MTTATFYLRPTFTARTSVAYPTTGNFNLALRFLSGQFGQTGSLVSRTARKSLLPDRDTPFLDAQGNVVDVWYRFLQFQYEKKLGGDNAPTVPQVAAGAADTQAVAAAFAGTITNVVQVVENNAAAQAASNEALVTASVPGATQIPPPVLTVPVYVAPSAPVPAPAPSSPAPSPPRTPPVRPTQDNL